MPDLTVIEGDGAGDDAFRLGWAQHWFANFTVELLRSAVRGSDYQAAGALLHFFDEVMKHSLTRGEVTGLVHEQLRSMGEALKPEDYPGAGAFADILGTSLQVVAERTCDDNAAKGRARQREQRLRNAIEGYVAARTGKRPLT